MGSYSALEHVSLVDIHRSNNICDNSRSIFPSVFEDDPAPTRVV